MNHERVQRFTEKLGAASDYYGLNSPGLTCYLNSVLQVLFMTEGFREEIQRQRSKDAGVIDAHLDSLFTDLKKRKARTHSIIKQLGITELYEQRDAAEYFENILRWTSPEASKIFRGQLNHKARCLHCEEGYDSRSNFWTLPLVVEDQHHQTYSVEQGFQAFFKGDKVCEDNVMFCNRCSEKRDAELDCEITHTPEVLTLLLKRFSFNKRQRCYVKLHCEVNVPQTLPVQSYTYKLYALVHHYGDLTGGHYTAEIKSFETGEWYHFNDDVVQMVSQPGNNPVRSRTAYLLMYRKGKPHSERSDRGNQEAGAEYKVEAGGRCKARERREDPVYHHQMNGDSLQSCLDDALNQKHSSGEPCKHKKQAVTCERLVKEPSLPEDMEALRLEWNYSHTLTDKGHNKVNKQQHHTDSKMHRFIPNACERPHNTESRAKAKTKQTKTISSSAGSRVSPAGTEGVKHKRDAGREKSREKNMEQRTEVEEMLGALEQKSVFSNDHPPYSPSLSRRRNKSTAQHPVSVITKGENRKYYVQHERPASWK